MLHPADWLVIVAYLALALWIGLRVREEAGTSRASYFLADRSLPWWWAGTSIAATTFAADTPLAIAGIVASRGVSGNWLWLSWVLVHAGVVVVFAKRWWRSGVITDAEFIGLRYSGRAAGWLRTVRAGLYGVVFNAIILGWVLRAMGKIIQPLFRWDEWTPGLVAFTARLVPVDSPIGGASNVLTIVMLVALVAVYSSLGGIRGVIRTDLVQFVLGLLGSVWLAVVAWRAMGGHTGLREGLVQQFGDAAPTVTALFPSLTSGWAASLEMGAFAFGAYLLVQSYANVPADGGGYLQQRLNACRSEGDAQKAAALFLVLQYGVRIWPWLVVGLAALVLIPMGSESAAIGATLGDVVAADREMAYPALMMQLLPPGIFGLLVVSLLAAFMSTIDTHFNWGASYVVTDVALRVRPDLSPTAQVRVARFAVVAFALLAVLVAFRIDRIEQAWRWVAVLGASLGVPTVLRWVWWRMTAAAELAGALAGLLVAAWLLANDSLAYEQQLVVISAVSTAAVLLLVAFGPRPADSAVARFQDAVSPLGIWPGRSTSHGARDIVMAAGQTIALAGAMIGVIWIGTRLLFA